MKKSILSVVLGTSLMVSSSAFALTAMTDSNMKSATGQAGVSIAIDDVTLYQSVGATTYTDTDGLTGASDAAGIEISGVETLTTIRAILDEGDRDGFLKFGYGAIMNSDLVSGTASGAETLFTRDDGTTFDVKGMRTGYKVGTDDSIGAIKVAPLTIDVSSKVQALSYGMAFNNRLAAVGAIKLCAAAGTNLADTSETGKAAAITTIKETFDTYKKTTLTDHEAEIVYDLAIDMLPSVSALTATAIANAAVATGLPDDPTQDEINEAAVAAALGAKSFSTATTGINVAGVVIGLPTIEIAKTGSIKRISAVATGSVNDDKAYIKIKTGASSLAVLGGYIEICPH
ncbi:DUF6160 family protein [Desulfoluna sp.]|uniref:DUF6160 family protein n=1 Tax=Desulfoluna sp. TaxID=2045199 RepID=UPI00263909E4|nr:DUF6160 family protein [Desulfoluna sp.]